MSLAEELLCEMPAKNGATPSDEHASVGPCARYGPLSPHSRAQMAPGMCCKSHAVSRTPAMNFLLSFLRLSDSSFYGPWQIETPQLVMGTLTVARVTVDDD